ncbi:GtrA family protein [Paraconexibacter antarcticus]|uniref:GtrA family protein n=1 Tax=Paraconexibacter antarcticus TaxID=2949664 RepID=A0ABY5DUG3_9ACTN|nr:GtrA family protein [Paraconexibacter antarcticus]UTI64472.1 GtrA family protein [Paraconexibacter antarcticus]
MSRAEVMRLVRFCEVGATNTAVTLVAYGLLVHAGCPGWLASALGFAAGAANGYHWNARWTFADRRREGDDGARLRYVAVQGAGSAASALGVLAAHHALGLAHLASEIVILPVVTVLTYGLMRTVVFPVRPTPDRALSA